MLDHRVPIRSRLARSLWSRHANPGSVWTLVAAYPALILAIYRRDQSLLVGTLAFVVANPILFPPPEDDTAWATRVVLGERAWLEQRSIRSRETLFVVASAPVYLLTLRAAIERRSIEATVGTILSLVVMGAFFRRMARLYGEPTGLEP